MTFTVQIRGPGGPERLVVLDGPTEVGRETQLSVADPTVSRRHLRLEPRAEGLVVADVRSTYGTTVNGHRLTGPVLCSPGDRILIGATELIVGTQTADTEISTTIPPAGAEAAGRTGHPQELRGDGVVVRCVPGTFGATLAAAVLERTVAARRRLQGFGWEPSGVTVAVNLIDPYPDPQHPGIVVTTGTVVDPGRREIWMVTTPESPPEAPERPLAALFAAGTPGAAVVGPLIEGYGLALVAPEGIEGQLAGLDLPEYEDAPPELATLMSVAFVRFLVGAHGEDSVRRMLVHTRPDDVDGSTREVLGVTLAEAEAAWRAHLSGDGGRVAPFAFLRLAGRYLRPHKRRQAEIFLYMLAGLAFTVAFPFATRRLFDDAIPSGEMSEVISLLGALAVALVITLVASVRRTYLSAYVSGAVIRDMRGEMFDRLQVLSARWYHARNQGDVLGRLFSDVGLVESGLSVVLREGLFQIVTFVVSAVVMLRLDLRLGVLVLLVAPLVVLVYRLMGRGAKERSLAVQEETSNVMSVAAENYEAEPVVKAFGLRGRENARFGQASERLFLAERRLVLFTGWFALSVNLVVTLLRMAVLGLGAWLILEGNLTTGGLVAFLGVMGSVLDPVTQLTSVGQELQTATGALQRVNDIIRSEPDLVSGPDARPWPGVQHGVTLRSVGFHYGDRRPVLRDVSITIPAGGRVAFVGPSGSGKSTVLRLLMRLWDPTAGAVLVDGVDMRDIDLDQLRAAIGMVLQDNFLFDATVFDNIALGRPGAGREEVEAAARAAEIHDAIVAMPRGYDTVVGERGALLSGGQRQRVAIARALIRQPALLLLDEATSALDPRTERQIMETLRRAAAGRTTVAITHRLSSVADYDRIVVIVDGRVEDQGTHEELLARRGVYAALWAEQTGTAPPPSIDVVEALAPVAPFSALPQPELERLAGDLLPVAVAPGEEIGEVPGRVHIVQAGRFQVIAPGAVGDLVLADLGPGGVHGVGALLGEPTGARLRAIDAGVLLRLTEDRVAALIATVPSFAAAVAGRAAPSAVPDGRRLARVSIVGAMPSVSDQHAAAGEGALVRRANDRADDEIRRTAASIRWPGAWTP